MQLFEIFLLFFWCFDIYLKLSNAFVLLMKTNSESINFKRETFLSGQVCIVGNISSPVLGDSVCRFLTVLLLPFFFLNPGTFLSLDRSLIFSSEVPDSSLSADISVPHPQDPNPL